ncbi:MAG: radical SAM protein, partial [Nitrospinaceae bacterium]|nr:radical SAM protein [Nitrospinaceae bacterium]
MDKQSLGLYIHIPYCIHKCGYCDFNSHPIKHDEMETYIDALIIEMSHYSQKYSSAGQLNTIFLGGGTPTTLSVSQLTRILEKCKNQFNITQDAEITLEANPATIRSDELKSIRQAGYNRISIGVQSFDEAELKLLDRAH